MNKTLEPDFAKAVTALQKHMKEYNATRLQIKGSIHLTHYKTAYHIIKAYYKGISSYTKYHKTSERGALKILKHKLHQDLGVRTIGCRIHLEHLIRVGILTTDTQLNTKNYYLIYPNPKLLATRRTLVFLANHTLRKP